MARRLVFRIHALRRMFERSIDVAQVVAAVEHGKTIARYDRDRPYPSRLILGWTADEPIRVVAADDPESDLTVVVTVYRPDLTLWTSDFRSRR